MKKIVCIIMLLSFLLFFPLSADTIQASIDERGIISSNTTWAKSGSPYFLTGPVAVMQGSTLIIEEGVTVYFNNNYLQVNGTLQIIGNTDDKTILDGGGLGAEIQFTQDSPSWNEATGTGSIIKNAILNSISIDINNTSPNISGNTLSGHINCRYSSSRIVNNDITGIGSPEIIEIFNSSVFISKNFINNNVIAILTLSDSSLLSENTIIDGSIGISSDGSTLLKNVILGCEVGIEAIHSSTIEQNLLINNNQGIRMKGYFNKIQYNTITNNTVGIYTYKSVILNYNNIFANSEYNLRLAEEVTQNIDASNNWWGTTDSQAISKKIYDNKNDFNLGAVNFSPILNAPNAAAPTVPQVLPTSMPNQPVNGTTNPSASPNSSDFQAGGLFGIGYIQLIETSLLVLIAVLLVVIAVVLHKRSVK